MSASIGWWVNVTLELSPSMKHYRSGVGTTTLKKVNNLVKNAHVGIQRRISSNLINLIIFIWLKVKNTHKNLIIGAIHNPANCACFWNKFGFLCVICSLIQKCKNCNIFSCIFWHTKEKFEENSTKYNENKRKLLSFESVRFFYHE